MRRGTWFVDNYIPACLQLSDCPAYISQLFDDVTTRTKLQSAVSALVAWRCRPNKSFLNKLDAFATAEYGIILSVYPRPITARSCVRWMTKLIKIDSCLSVYSTAVAFLHVSSRSLRSNGVKIAANSSSTESCHFGLSL